MTKSYRLQWWGTLRFPHPTVLFRKRLIALTPYSLIAFATINLFTYSPMFLITETNCNDVAATAAAVAAVVAGPSRARRAEEPVVGVVALELFT